MTAIASGKGGVGKTWFSITLAHALAKAGAKTLLFDGALGLANLDIQLGLTPKHDLGGVIAGRLTLNQAVTAYDEGDFDIIAGRSGSGGLVNISAGRMKLLSDDLGVLAAEYDKVLIDLGAGVERVAGRPLENHELLERSAAWSPWRSIASLYLWKIAHWEGEPAG